MQFPDSIALVALLCAGLAGAELTQKGNLRLQFNGRIAPKKLPRTGSAPVTIRVSGAIGTADGQRPPELEKIAIAFNRRGHVSTEGLPVCEPGELEQTTSKSAREACGGALVGRGKFKANVALPGRNTFPVTGDILAFNSSKNGNPALLLHIYGSNPVQLVFVLSFRIVRVQQGEFGTIFVANIPADRRRPRLRHQHRHDLRPALRARGREAQLPERRLRRPAGHPGRDLHPRPRQLQLRQRAADQHSLSPATAGSADLQAGKIPPKVHGDSCAWPQAPIDRS